MIKEIKNNLLKKSSTLCLGLFIFLTPLAVIFAQSPKTEIEYPSFWDLTPPSDFAGWVAYVVKLLLLVGILLAVLQIVWAGVKYTSSSVDPSQKQDAKDRLKYAIIGLILLFSFFVILQTMSQGFVNIVLKQPAEPTGTWMISVPGIGTYIPGVGWLGEGAVFYPKDVDPNSVGECLDEWLRRKKSSSPLIGYGIHFATSGQRYGVNPAFLLAMSGAESSFATHWGALKAEWHNYASLTCGCSQKAPCARKEGSSNPRKWEVYETGWIEAIEKHAGYTYRRYFSRGIYDIDSIGRIFVGDSGASSWAQNVKIYIAEIVSACPDLKN